MATCRCRARRSSSTSRGGGVEWRVHRQGLGLSDPVPMRPVESPWSARERELEDSMRLILGTAYGERPMRPEFGCAIHDYVFASVNATTAGLIAYEVKLSLTRWEPRVDIIDVVVTHDEGRPGTMFIDIRYVERETNDPRNLVFPFYVIPSEPGSDHRDRGMARRSRSRRRWGGRLSMTLPVPNLDDRRFQELVDDAKRLVQRRCPEWTAHNVSDPGVTLIETFAYMVDQLLFRLNRVPERNYIKFLELIGVRLFPPVAAHAPVTFWLSAPVPERRPHPRGHRGGNPANRDGGGDHLHGGRRPRYRALLSPTSGRRAADGFHDHGSTLEGGPGFQCFNSDPASGRRLAGRPVRPDPALRRRPALRLRGRRGRGRSPVPARCDGRPGTDRSGRPARWTGTRPAVSTGPAMSSCTFPRPIRRQSSGASGPAGFEPLSSRSWRVSRHTRRHPGSRASRRSPLAARSRSSTLRSSTRRSSESPTTSPGRPSCSSTHPSYREAVRRCSR